MAKENNKEGIGMDISYETKADQNPSVLQSSYKGKTDCYASSHRHFTRKGSCGTCGRLDHTRILQPHVLETKEVRRATTNNRPVSFKPLYNLPHVQDGNRPIHSFCVNKRTVDSEPGHEGCLFSYPHQKVLPEISPVCVQGQGLAVLRLPVWSLGCPLGFHGSHVVSRQHLSSEGDINTPLFGRLAFESGLTRGSTKSCKNSNRPNVHSRTYNQRREVRDGSDPEPDFLRVRVRPTFGYCTPDRRKCQKSSGKSPIHYQNRESLSERVAKPDRQHQCDCTSNTFGTPAGMSPRHTCTQGVVLDRQKPHNHEYCDSNRPGVTRHTKMVDTTRSMECGSITPSVQARHDPVYRCQLSRLGRSYRDTDNIGNMDKTRICSTHKRSGMLCSSAGINELFECRKGEECVDCNRQHNNPSVHQQIRRDKIPGDVSSHKKSIDVVLQSENYVESHAYQGLAQRDGRLTVKKTKNCADRVEPSPRNSEQSLGNMVQTRDGLICNTIQPQTPQIRESFSRPDGSRSRRDVLELEQSVSVCLSPVCTSQSSGEKIRTNRTLSDDIGGSVLANEKLVRDTGEISSGSTNRIAKLGEVTQTTNTANISRELRTVKTTRVELIKKRLEKCGFSSSVVDRLSQAVRPSTSSLYDKRWKSFVKWCEPLRVSPLEASVPQILDYLEFLFTELKLVAGTVTGHKTAIIMTIERATNRVLRDNTNIKSYIKAMLRTVKPVSRIPLWDLALVLEALKKTPFEPLSQCSLRNLTLKTVFLVAFATAARRSELHALSDTIVSDLDGTYIRLKTVDGFLAKNQTLKSSTDSFRSFMIKKLPVTDSPSGEGDSLLCPVRAVHTYNERVTRTPGNNRLFVSCRKGMKNPIHPNTISNYIKKCIKLAYKLSGKPMPENVKAHSVRGMSASWASLRNVSTQTILDSCFWQSKNTFLNYYLKDLTEIEGDMCKLGKVSVASNVV